VFGKAPSETVRCFPDKLPVGVERDGYRHVFLYPARSSSPMDFRLFLLRHLESSAIGARAAPRSSAVTALMLPSSWKRDRRRSRKNLAGRPSRHRVSSCARRSARLVASLRPRAWSARGLRALTEPALSSPDRNCVMAPVTEVPRAARVSDAIRRTQRFGLRKGEGISVASALGAASDRR
jgi:hypothetical protein